MALFDQWQAQRQQRQQELRARQQQVSDDLAAWRQNRTQMGREMRHFLSDYHGQIVSQIQAFNQQTQLFLSNCRSQRDRDTQALMQALDNFANTLAAETAEFLNHVAEDRLLMATQQTEELQDFHNHLNISVAQFVQQCRDRRMDLKAELTAYLDNFINQLSSDVAAYLQELYLQRQEMADRLQETFQADREQRSQTMQTLYDRFANSRRSRQQNLVNSQQEMWRDVKAYRANLFNQVWGNIPGSTVTTPPSSASSPSLASPAPTQPARVLQSQGKAAAPAPPKRTPPPPSAAPQQPSPAQSIQSASAMMQKAVYDYIKQAKSARLKDIEESLKINRIQAVDILKVLMAKGLITQNNRNYIVVETN